jgi:nucleoside 2-deoxyribosyltransferase
MKTIYLCGPITGLTYGGCTNWRDYVRHRLAYGMRGISPMRDGKAELDTGKPILDTYENSLMSSQRAITTRDRYDTMHCDAILANLLDAERVSIGSMIELGWADSVRTPIIAVMRPDNIHWHAMVREVAGWIVPTLDEAIQVANNILSEHAA